LYDGEPLLNFVPEVREDPMAETVKKTTKRPDIKIPDM